MLNFFNQHALTPIDLHFGDNVGWTFETHSGDSRSWIDHTVVSNSLVNKVLEVCTLDCVSNFSDHRPVCIVCQLEFGVVFPDDTIEAKQHSSIVWNKASNEDLQRYASLVYSRLDELSI